MVHQGARGGGLSMHSSRQAGPSLDSAVRTSRAYGLLPKHGRGGGGCHSAADGSVCSAADACRARGAKEAVPFSSQKSRQVSFVTSVSTSSRRTLISACSAPLLRITVSLPRSSLRARERTHQARAMRLTAPQAIHRMLDRATCRRGSKWARARTRGGGIGSGWLAETLATNRPMNLAHASPPGLGPRQPRSRRSVRPLLHQRRSST
jgi:hypothetical protein